MSKKILISTTTFAEFDKAPIDLLQKEGFICEFNPYKRKMTGDEIVQIGKGAVGIIAGTEKLDSSVLENLEELKIISRCGVGMDNVDLESARSKGIKVCNTPDGPTLAVAELTVGLILSLLRKVNKMDDAIRSGKWEKMTGNLLNGKKVGIVGFGRIGQKVAKLLSGFEVEIIYCDIEDKSTSIECTHKDFEELLSESDIVSLHLSSLSGGKILIGDKELKLMKKGSWLINISRGGIVDEAALYEALKARYLSGAAIDVFEKEPYTGPLTELENVILTPHIGSYAREARIKMEITAAKNLLTELKND